jgi:predicted nucleotidyltransferase
MRTEAKPKNLAEILWPAARRAIFDLLFFNTGQEWHLREIARRTGVSPSALHAELRTLAAAEVVSRRVESHRAYYRANPACPILPELRQIVLKTSGLGDALRAALAPLAKQAPLAFIYGSFAGGRETAESDIDVLLVGRLTSRQVAAIFGPLKRELGREFNCVVYSPNEFREKIGEGHHFLKAVLKGPKIFLIGDEHELAALAR